MPYIDYDPLSPSEYLAFRFQVMKAVWGAQRQPEVDADGIPRIGTHIDLRTNMVVVAEAILGPGVDTDLIGRLQTVVNKTYDNADDGLLQKRLNAVLKEWSQTEDPSIPTKFQFSSDAQMRAVLNNCSEMPDAEGEFDARSGDFDFSNLEERAAIVAMAYEEADLLDNGVMDALLDGTNRFNAWYALRYESNDGDGAADRRQTALRRYIQSDFFELYNDPQHVGFAEALQVARGYQNHRGQILAYEDSYDAPGNGASGAGPAGGLVSGGISAHLQPTIRQIARHYDLAIGPLEEVLFVQRGRLHGDGTRFDSRKNDDDLLVGNDRDNVIDGQQGDDVLAGLGGNDRLLGGTGDDRLYGGTGNDLVSGSAGRDRLFGGAGKDRLDGGEGSDVLNGDGGNDILLGRDGNDRLFGGADSDRLEGGSGRDSLNGEAGRDLLRGGLGNDVLDGGAGRDRLEGGAGNDLYRLSSAEDQVVEAPSGGSDTALIDSRGAFNIRNVELMRMGGDVAGGIAMALNQFDRFTLSSGDDALTLTINRLQKQPIDIVTRGGADTITFRFAAGVDPSQVLDHQGLTARFDFADLSGNDTIDLTSIGIRRIVVDDFDISADRGYYLMAPDAQLHLMKGGDETKTYTNDTSSWFVVKCGDETPYGPEFIGNIHKDNFDI